jgi:hypothetical protein
MLHNFFDDKPWFAAKSYGYGAGLPIARQGWVLMVSYIAAMLGVGLLMASPNGGIKGLAVMLFLVLTSGFMLICKRRTRGGWRWRNGDDT